MPAEYLQEPAHGTMSNSPAISPNFPIEQMVNGFAALASIPQLIEDMGRQIAGLRAEIAALRESRQKASKWLKLREAAEVLNTSPKTVRRYIERGLLKRNAASRHILIPTEDVEGLRKKVVV